MQVATLVVPFTVLLAWAMGQPLDLNFNAFESLILFASVIIVVVSLMVSGAHAHMHEPDIHVHNSMAGSLCV